VLKSGIFLLQVGFIGDFVSDCPLTVFLSVQTLTPLFFLTVPNFCTIFSGCWIGNLMKISKICLK